MSIWRGESRCDTLHILSCSPYSYTLFTGHEVGNIMTWQGKEKSNKQNVVADVLKMGL